MQNRAVGVVEEYRRIQLFIVVAHRTLIANANPWSRDRKRLRF
jgi:hypothetical protein